MRDSRRATAPLFRRVWGPAWPRLLAGDALVLSLLAAGILAAALPGRLRGTGTRAEVLVAGGAPVPLDLAGNGVREVRGPLGVTRLEVRHGRVRVLSSPCPRQVCRHGGWIDAPGQALVCIPNGVVVRVEGAPRDGADAVSR